MKVTKSQLIKIIKEEILKEVYLEKDFDPNNPRNIDWDGRVTWNAGFIEEPIPGKFIMQTVNGERVPKLDADGNPIPKTKTLRDSRTGTVELIKTSGGTVGGIAKIYDDNGDSHWVEIAELTKA
jgi:hypothetical protein